MVCVSVIIPIYKVEKYLNRCVESIVNQTIKDIEIIMVDDGSPDSCPQICDEWAKKDARIRVVHKKNGGLGDARNAGLNIAVGEYVAFIDSDDYQSLEAYDTLYKEAKKHDADIVYGGLVYYDKSGKSNLCSLHQLDFEGKEVITYLKRVLNQPKAKSTKDEYCMSVCIGLFRRSIIEQYKVRFRSERMVLSEDLLFDVELIPHCRSIRYIPYCFYHYCYNGESLTQTFNPIKIERCICQYETMLRVAEQLNISEIKSDIIDNFIMNIRGSIMKGIILSNMAFHDKKKHLKTIYGYKEWNNIFKLIKIQDRSKLEQIILFIIKYRCVLVNILVYRLYSSLVKK